MCPLNCALIMSGIAGIRVLQLVELDRFSCPYLRSTRYIWRQRMPGLLSNNSCSEAETFNLRGVHLPSETLKKVFYAWTKTTVISLAASLPTYSEQMRCMVVRQKEVRMLEHIEIVVLIFWCVAWSILVQSDALDIYESYAFDWKTFSSKCYFYLSKALYRELDQMSRPNKMPATANATKCAARSLKRPEIIDEKVAETTFKKHTWSDDGREERFRVVISPFSVPLQPGDTKKKNYNLLSPFRCPSPCMVQANVLNTAKKSGMTDIWNHISTITL